MPFAAKWLSLLLLPFLLPSCAFASTNLLTNPSFETLENGLPSNWQRNYSTLELSATSGAAFAHSDQTAIVFQSQTSSQKYLYQPFLVTPSQAYRFTGFTKLLDGNAKLFLRLSWYESPDGTGTELENTVSPQNTAPSDWVELKLESTAPTKANSARAKLVLDPKDSSLAKGVFDSVSLLEISTSSSVLQIDFQLPSKAIILNSFEIKVVLKGASPNATYQVRPLGGTGSTDNSLYSLSVENNGHWYPWNGSWSSLPTLATDSQGVGEKTLVVRFGETAASGSNNLLIRLRRLGTEINLDSTFKEITLEKSSPPPAPSETVPPPASSAPMPPPATDSSSDFKPPTSLGPAQVPSVLGSFSAFLAAASSSSSTPTSADKVPSLELPAFLEVALILSGVILTVSSLLYLFRAKIWLLIQILFLNET